MTRFRTPNPESYLSAIGSSIHTHIEPCSKLRVIFDREPGLLNYVFPKELDGCVAHRRGAIGQAVFYGMPNGRLLIRDGVSKS